MNKRDFPPVHPGEILREEFLLPLGISQYRLERAVGAAREESEQALVVAGLTDRLAVEPDRLGPRLRRLACIERAAHVGFDVHRRPAPDQQPENSPC